VEKCLRSSPVRRYSSAGEVADGRDRFLRGLPIRARQASVAERLVTWTRRHPGWFAAAILATLLLGSAVTGAWHHAVRLDRANRLANEARATAQSALAQLTGGWVQRMMTRGITLDSADRAFLGEVRDLYRGWSGAADPVGALRFRVEGLGQIARIFANLDGDHEAITLFDEALAALDDYERRGGDASAVTSLRLLLLRDQTQMLMRYREVPRAAELVDRLERLLDDPTTARASSATDRSIVLRARLGALIMAIKTSGSSLPGVAPPQALAGVEQILDELGDLERHHAAEPAAAIGQIEGLIAAATALSPVTGPAVAGARLRRAEGCAARAFDRFDGAPTDVRDRFRRHRLLAPATRCDIELAGGAAADSLASARELDGLTREPMEREETADLFYRGEHVEAVIREARAAAALGAGAGSIAYLKKAVDIAARSVTEQPAVFVHTGRLARALQCQSFVLESVGRTAEAAASARRVAFTLVPWRDSPARAEWARSIIEEAHARSAQLRIDAGDLRGAVDDHAKLLALTAAERRPEAARRLLAAGRAAGRYDTVAEALAAILRHDAQARASVLRTLGIDLTSESPPSAATVPRE
jgi:tetratricopeptide (TPR) repeat protein